MFILFSLYSIPYTEAFRFSISSWVSFSNILKSFSSLIENPWLHGLQHTRLHCPSLSSRVCSNSRPSSWWCHPTISSSVVPFSSCPQSFPASRSFPMNQLFTSGGQNIGASASASVLPRSIQGWLPLGTGWISLLSKGLSRVSSSTTVQNISSSALCLLYRLALISVHGHWGDHSFDYAGLFCKVMSLLFNVLSRFIVTFLPGSILLISWWQSPSALISELRKRESLSLLPPFPLLSAMKWRDWMPWS